MWTGSMTMVIRCLFLVFKIHQVPYNKPLTNLACSSCTGKDWSLVILVLTLLHLVCTATTSGQYSSVQPLVLVSKRLVFLLIPKSLVEGKCLRSQGAATAVTSQGARTPDWPGQATSTPCQAPYRHKSNSSQIAEWEVGKKKKKGKRSEPLNYYLTDHATLTEQRTHCKHMGCQHKYQPRISLDIVSPRAPKTI